MIGQLPGAWNVATRPQFSFRYQLADLVADLFVQRVIAPRFNLERNLNGGWTTNCGRGREMRRLMVGGDNASGMIFYITHLAPQQLRAASDWYCRFFCFRSFPLNLQFLSA